MSKVVTYEELQEHKQKDNLWVLLNGQGTHSALLHHK
jgi:cytochrome b involved in lipid metabolism